jgi:hypothetical protein
VYVFRYLEAMVMNPNSIDEEINSGLNSRNACYHEDHNLLCSHLLRIQKRIKIQNYNLPIVSCVCVCV